MTLLVLLLVGLHAVAHRGEPRGLRGDLDGRGGVRGAVVPVDRPGRWPGALVRRRRLPVGDRGVRVQHRARGGGAARGGAGSGRVLGHPSMAARLAARAGPGGGRVRGAAARGTWPIRARSSPASTSSASPPITRRRQLWWAGSLATTSRISGRTSSSSRATTAPATPPSSAACCCGSPCRSSSPGSSRCGASARSRSSASCSSARWWRRSAPRSPRRACRTRCARR